MCVLGAPCWANASFEDRAEYMYSFEGFAASKMPREETEPDRHVEISFNNGQQVLAQLCLHRGSNERVRKKTREAGTHHLAIRQF